MKLFSINFRKRFQNVIKNYKINLKGGKLLKQLILSNLLVALISIIVMGLSTIFIANSITEENIINSNNTRLIQTKEQMDSYVEDMYKINRLLSSNTENLLQFRKWTLADKKSLVFKEWLDNFNLYMQNYNNLVNSVWIYYLDIVIDTNNGINTITDFNNWNYIARLTKIARERFNYVPYISQPYTPNISTYSNKNPEQNPIQIFSIITPINVNDSSFNSGAVIVNMNYNLFTRKLSLGRKPTESITYIYESENNSIFTKSSKDILDSDLLTDNITSKILPEDDDIYKGYININNKKYSMHIKRSAVVSHWYYVSLNDQSVITSKVATISKTFGSIVLWMLIFELLITTIISKFIYRPIQQIISNLNSMLISAKNDEFDTINNYIATLQDENSQIHQQFLEKQKILLEYTPKLSHSIVYSLLHSKYHNSQDIQNDLKNLDISFTESYFAVVLLCIDDYFDILQNNEHLDVILIQSNLLNALNKKLHEHYNCIGTHIDDNKYAFILNTSAVFDMEYFNQFFISLNNYFIKDYAVTFSVCIGNTINEYESICTEYTHLLAISREKFCRGNSAVLTPYNTNTKISNSTLVQKSTFNEITNAIMKNNPEKAEVILEDFWKNLENASAVEIKYIVDELVNSVEQIFDNNRGIFDFNSANHKIEQIFAYSNINYLKAYIKTLLSHARTCYEADSHVDIGNQIKTYIYYNYYKDISLDHLAEKFGLSTPYLSKLFKSKNNIGVIEYLNQVRIDHAKDLLQSTNIPINIIGQKIGFTTYGSFSRVFKKVTAMSAKDYKNKYRQI